MNEEPSKKIIRVDAGPAFDLILEMKARQQQVLSQNALLAQQYHQNEAELAAYMEENAQRLARLVGVEPPVPVEIDTRYLADHRLAFVHIGGVEGGLVAGLRH